MTQTSIAARVAILAGLVVLVIPAFAAPAPQPAPAQSPLDAATTTDIHRVLTQLVDSGKVEGVALMIGRGNEVILKEHAGTTTPDTSVPIASATKWVTSAVVLAQVDRGLVKLDSRWQPEDPPQLGGGLVSNAHEYFRFLQMIANDGVLKVEGPAGATERRVLSASAIQAMETNQIAGLEKDAVTAAIPGAWGYGLGLWCETVSAQGRCNAASSAGAFGTTPFVDRQKGYFGVLVTRGSPVDIVPALTQIRLKLNEALGPLSPSAQTNRYQQ